MVELAATSTLSILAGAWGAACVIAFCVGYADPDARTNPDHDDQLRSLSGIMTFSKPLFGFLMGCFGCTCMAGLAVRFQQQPGAMVLSLLLCWMLIGLVSFDVFGYKAVHNLFLAAFLITGFALVHAVDPRRVSVPLCDGLLALFVGVRLVNALCMGGAYPLMTVQAVCEALWAAAFGAWVVDQARFE